jgi:hypothetical protein
MLIELVFFCKYTAIKHFKKFEVILNVKVLGLKIEP